MSIAIQCFDCPTFRTEPSSIGFSNDSQKLIKNIKKQIREICEAITISRPLEKTFGTLKDIYLVSKCSEANWDGYGAHPVTSDAFGEAWKLIQLLPSFIPAPEITAEPAGEIGLEWRKGRRLVFVVSVSGKQTITYAGLFGDNETHGSEYFGESLPSIILENLKRLFH